MRLFPEKFGKSQYFQNIINTISNTIYLKFQLREHFPYRTCFQNFIIFIVWKKINTNLCKKPLNCL